MYCNCWNDVVVLGEIRYTVSPNQKLKECYKMLDKEGLYFLMGTHMIAYIKSKGIEEEIIEITDDTGKLKYWFKSTDELFDIIRDFKDDIKIQNFLKCQNEVKMKMIELRKQR
jgi:hypothetical protein